MSDKPFVLCAVFARGGSKRVPRKNVRMVGGKPLVAHAIETALGSELIDAVVVSTDDTEIADVARKYGAEVPFTRPAELAGDGASEWLAWQHAINAWNALPDRPKAGIFVSVPPTSPLRTTADVDKCVWTLLEGDCDIVITVTNPSHNPYYNMVVLDENGYARQVIEGPDVPYRREEYPAVFGMTTVAYAAKPEFILDSQLPFTGKVKTVAIPPERALDIDTELDLQFADFLLS